METIIEYTYQKLEWTYLLRLDGLRVIMLKIIKGYKVSFGYMASISGI